ncbi:major tail protein [Vagococcus vulneris]|uniref:Phage tail protein n=1 Tax=Vagococcus vulneris TaxID=1977869 RepID=A0A429ZT82_9ENTE|nr:major tail protein [Vagococcus vulneris]RST96943.1 hypothetical protein CBF37_10320 [Vagococcus vulneris]
MATYGFRRMHIVTNIDDATNKKHYIVEGNKDLGATSTAEITGINKEPKPIPGSDGIYTILAQGTGKVSINLGILDLPYEIDNEILGFAKDDDGFYDIGEDILPPNTAIVLESSDLRGVPLFWGFYNGKFTKETEKMETKSPDNDDIEAETYTFSPTSITQDNGKSSVGKKYKGADKKDAFLKLFGIDNKTETKNLIVPDKDAGKK